MTINLSEVTINGKTYVEKESQIKQDSDYVLVRSDRAGVFVGIIKEKDDSIRKIVLQNALWIWYWDGAASVMQLALEGVSKPENCKFPPVVPEQEIFEVIQTIPCTEKAVKSLYSVKPWKN